MKCLSLVSFQVASTESECPNSTGSENFTYKETFSKLLLLLGDFTYIFIYVGVGFSGGRGGGNEVTVVLLPGLPFMQQLTRTGLVFLTELHFPVKMWHLTSQ